MNALLTNGTLNTTQLKALKIMDRSGFSFLGDSEVGKGPRANKRAFLALERLGYVETADEGFGPLWRLTQAGRDYLNALPKEKKS